ncbi:hypothetical protein NHF40_07860 [Maricaulaceae bacterium EIL42A08]|nr:hypothetical protein [Maricaulaceae bacterium EIL42A08]
MTLARTRLGIAAVIASLAAACSATTTSSPTAGFEAAAPAAASAPQAMPQAAGYQISGDTFAGDLAFEAQGARVVATYRHAVDGAEMLIAEMDIDQAFLVDGVRRFEGLSDRGVEMMIEMVAGPCAVGGRTYPRFVTVIAGRLMYEGCAREVGPAVTWAEDLPRYLPAIAACEAAGSQSSMAFARRGEGAVIHARTDGDTALVRYEYGQSGRWECAFERGRASWSIVNESAPALADEGVVRFIPGRVPAAGEGCYLYERVERADGSIIGALAHDVCTPGFASFQVTRI